MIREQVVEELRKVCREIGCSGLDPKMCKERPHYCAIIRRLMAPAVEEGKHDLQD